jgi:glutamate synthase (NADPH/NADH) small chain
MGNPKAFLTIPRQEAGYRPVTDRIHDYGEVEQTLNNSDRRTQASRCMDCGVPFCHWACPIGNKQPEWQDMLYRGRWKDAYYVLEQTCDFPEFTGRICPALCEKSCVLSLSIHEPVTIRENEVAIAEMAFREGYIRPVNPVRNGMKVAVVGSGPAGLTVANQLNRKGFEVTVFEKDERPGGLLRYGIPNFKLGKTVIDRRILLMETEGVRFRTKTKVGKDISAKEIVDSHDAVCIAIGCEVPRDLPVEGRNLKGIYFAMDLLSQQIRILQQTNVPRKDVILAKDKRVLVIGGGDTGSDCVGTANRHGAASVTQIEILPKPPAEFNPQTPWPMYPQILKTSSSHEEGCVRRWNLTTNRFIGEKGVLKGVEVEEVEWIPAKDGGRPAMQPTGKKEILEADLAFLSMGFVNPVQDGLLKELALQTTERRTVATDADGRTSCPDVFACGDAASGASLVVRAMASGRRTAGAIEKYLSKKQNANRL